MNALKEDTMYIFEMIDRRKSRAGSYCNEDSTIGTLGTIKYLGNRKQMIEIKNMIVDYNSSLSRDKNVYEQYYVDYIGMLTKGSDINTEFHLGGSYKSRVIYECEILHETELTHIENTKISDIISDSSSSNYENIQFKTLDYKFKYVKHANNDGNECFNRFIYFKFEDLVEEIWKMDKFNKIIDEDIEFLNLVKEGNIEDIYKIKPNYTGFSREKLIYQLAIELKLLTEKFRVLTYEGNLGVTNEKYGDKEFIPTPSDAKSTIETFVLMEEYSFINLKELEDDIKQPREINFKSILGDLSDSVHNILLRAKNRK